MTTKWTAYQSDEGAIYGVEVDAKTLNFLRGLAPSPAYDAGYDTLALLIAANGSVAGALPATLTPRQIKFSLPTGDLFGIAGITGAYAASIAAYHGAGADATVRVVASGAIGEVNSAP